MAEIKPKTLMSFYYLQNKMGTPFLELVTRALKYEVGAFLVSFIVGIFFFGYRPLTLGYSITIYFVLSAFYVFFHWKSGL